MGDRNNSIQVLFSREEIHEIDEIISGNMDSYMDVLLNNYIRKILIAQFSQQIGANGIRLSDNFEASIIELFNIVCQQKRVIIQRLQTEIHNLSCEKVQRDQMMKKISDRCNFYQKMEIQHSKIQQQNKKLLLKEQQLMITQEIINKMKQNIMKNQKQLQQIPLLLQKAKENDELKEQLVKLNKSLRQSNEQNQKLELIQQRLNKTVQQLQQKSASLQIVTSQIEQLQKELSQLKNIQKNSALTQTDQMLPQVYGCSLIKKQLIHQSVGRIQTEQSSYRICSSFENKQNIPITNSFQKVGLTIGQKQGYKQKIFTLNEIINYLINFAKGYSEDNIRRGSWFYSRISLHGEEYEKKLMNPHHLEPKRTNIKFIRQLVKKDNNCAKLIKEFQSIIIFYCQQSQKQYTNSDIHNTLYEQQKLNKTINKFKNHGNQNIPHLL